MPVRPALRWVPDATAGDLNIDPYSHWLLVHGRPFLPGRRAFSHIGVVRAGEGFRTLLKTGVLELEEIDAGGDWRALIGRLSSRLAAKGANRPENHVFLTPLPDRSLTGLAARVDLARGATTSLTAGDEIDATRPLVITGVIDDHINVFHACFRTGDATRVDFAWFQDGERVAADPAADLAPVPFGRELTKADIDAAKGTDAARLRAFGLVDFRRQGANPLALRASHGTHVADIAAGSLGRAPLDRNCRVVAVSLPSLVSFDTSGATLGPCFVAGLEYVIRRARDLAVACRRRATLVINCSYGVSAGPHDGGHFIEQAIEALVADAQSGSDPDLAAIHVVLPAGNNNLDRGHASTAAVSAVERTELGLAWRIQPGDHTPSFLEIWMPGGAEDIEVTVQPPGGREALHFDAHTGARLLCRNGTAEPGDVVARVHRAMVGGRARVVTAVAPTVCLDPSLASAPHGVWTVTARARIAPGARIEAWIQRDTSPIGASVQGRQSYFDDPLYQRFDAGGRALTDDPPDSKSTVRRRGTLNGIATGGRAIVAAGYAADARGVAAAPYSATGFGDDRNPTVAALCDRSGAVGGMLAAGTLSGTRVAINGTSVAAPTVARRIARHALEGGAGLPELADTILPDGSNLKSRVGTGWLAPAPSQH